jgi:acyl-CoA thioesterase-1
MATIAERGPGALIATARSLLLALALVLAPAAVRAELKILCLGDSLTEGYGLAADESYPALLERRLHAEGRADVMVINAGISGSTSASGVSRLRWQLRGAPQILLLALGANDGLRGLDLAVTRRHLAEVIALAKAGGLKVLLAGMKLPPNYGPEYTRGFERMYGELAREHAVPLIPFLLEGVAGDPELNLSDGIHPNARGHEIVANTVYRYLLPLL